MSITSIYRDTNNNVSIVRMTSTDTIATVTSNGYVNAHQADIDSLNGGTWGWFPSDMVLIAASDGNVLATFSDSTFSTLIEYSGSGVSPVQVQNQSFTHGADTGAADAYVVNLSPAVTALVDGMSINFTPSNSSTITGYPTININGLGALGITGQNFSTLVPGDLTAFTPAVIIYNADDGSWQLQNPQVSGGGGGGVTADEIQRQVYTYALDTGAANAIVVDLSPTITSNASVLATFQCAYNNTGATTIDCGFGFCPLVDNYNQALVGGELLAGGTYIAIFNTAINSYVLINSSLSGGGGGVSSTQVQQQVFNYSVDSGVADAYVATLSPAPGSYTDGMLVALGHVLNTSTGTVLPTLNVNGLGAISITTGLSQGVAYNDLSIGSICYFIYNDAISSFILLNPGTMNSVNSSLLINVQVADAGSSGNTYVGTNISFPTYDYVDAAPVPILFFPAVTNTGASTLNVNGQGDFPIKTLRGVDLTSGQIQAHTCTWLQINGDGDTWLLMTPA